MTSATGFLVFLVEESHVIENRDKRATSTAGTVSKCQNSPSRTDGTAHVHREAALIYIQGASNIMVCTTTKMMSGVHAPSIPLHGDKLEVLNWGKRSMEYLL